MGEVFYGVMLGAYRLARNALGLKVEKPVVAGNWHANDTCWRMAVDLMNILFFADADGVMRELPQRRFFSVVDGIVGGQRNGPLSPKPIESRLVVAGNHPYAVDMAVARLMGFDWRKIPQLAYLSTSESLDSRCGFFRIEPSDGIEIRSEDRGIATMMSHREVVNTPFEPHPGWVGHIEL